MQSAIGRRSLSPVVTVNVDDTVHDALALMSLRNVGSLIVLSEDKPAGILTGRDVVFAANWMLGQPNLLVGQVMNKEVFTAEKGITVNEACLVFKENPVRHLVVVDDHGRLAGLFTQTALVESMDHQIYPDEMTVADLMTHKVMQADAGTSIRYALSLMARHAISGVLVVGEQAPLGFFTEKNVIEVVTGERDLGGLRLDEVPLTPVVTIASSAHPVQAFSLMKKKSVRQLLVHDFRNAPAGVLTKTDLSRNLNCDMVSDRFPQLQAAKNQPAPESYRLSN